MQEALHFIILTEHKPLTFAFNQMTDKGSPRQFNHLHFVSQFNTEIRHISGQDKFFADSNIPGRGNHHSRESCRVCRSPVEGR
jgi:hypothetical protein